KILQEMLFEPKFDDAEFELEKKKQLDNISQQYTSAAALARMAYRQLLYGDTHVMGVITEGTAETVQKLQPGDVRNFYRSAFLKNNVTISVSGDISKELVLKELAFLSRLPAGKSPVAAAAPEQKID